MWSHSATTDQNGHYVLKDISPRKYKVMAKLPEAAAGTQAAKSEAVTVMLASTITM